ncbi:MAG: carboxylating nicotinate-nucleotide diphosphorylase [Myxococcota bacterium]|nr:carboxylating nicotinate-nucleotide diphosphorylase [Myxococcota bacterium]
MKLAEIVRLALLEDVGHGDVTTEATVPAELEGSARIIAKQELVVCGHDIAAEVFRQMGATYTPEVGEGELVEKWTVIARVSGPMRGLLTGERLALNFMMRLCGIATHTHRTVARAGTLKVVDTRKTTPLIRRLERRAVKVGGGSNHRFALYDGILIKDNHIKAAGGVSEAIQRARSHAHHLLRIEIEVETLDELRDALALGVDAALLDNMDDETLKAAIALNRAFAAENGTRPAILEASGNMDADRIERISDIGLDVVSMGGLIHQATWADLSMKAD